MPRGRPKNTKLRERVLEGLKAFPSCGVSFAPDHVQWLPISVQRLSESLCIDVGNLRRTLQELESLGLVRKEWYVRTVRQMKGIEHQRKTLCYWNVETEAQDRIYKLNRNIELGTLFIQEASSRLYSKSTCIDMQTTLEA